MADEAGVLDAVQQHVRCAQHVGERLFFDGTERRLDELLVGGRLDVVCAHVAKRGREKPSRPARGVEDDLAGLRGDPLGHERGDRSRRVVLARVAGALEVVEDLFVDVAEVLPLGEVVEVNLVDLVDDLTEQLPRFHVVVRVLEDTLDDAPAVRCHSRGGEFLEGRKEVVVDEAEQLVPGNPFRVRRPRPPPQRLGNRGTVGRVEEFEFLVLVVEDLQEEHPAELRDPLGIAVDARVLPHGVLNRLDGGPDAHGLPFSLGNVVESFLKLVNGGFELLLASELPNQLDGGPHRIERRYLEDANIIEVPRQPHRPGTW